MNNTTELKGSYFNGKRCPKFKRLVTAPRKFIRTKLRVFLPLNLETFTETCPVMSQ